MLAGPELGLELLQERKVRSAERGDQCVCKSRFSSFGPTSVAIFVQPRPNRKYDVVHFRELYLCMEKERCVGTHAFVCHRTVDLQLCLSWLGM